MRGMRQVVATAGTQYLTQTHCSGDLGAGSWEQGAWNWELGALASMC